MPGTPFSERDQARQPTPWKSWGRSGGLKIGSVNGTAEAGQGRDGGAVQRLVLQPGTLATGSLIARELGDCSGGGEGGDRRSDPDRNSSVGSGGAFGLDSPLSRFCLKTPFSSNFESFRHAFVEYLLACVGCPLARWKGVGNHLARSGCFLPENRGFFSRISPVWPGRWRAQAPGSGQECPRSSEWRRVQWSADIPVRRAWYGVRKWQNVPAGTGKAPARSLARRRGERTRMFVLQLPSGVVLEKAKMCPPAAGLL